MLVYRSRDPMIVSRLFCTFVVGLILTALGIVNGRATFDDSTPSTSSTQASTDSSTHKTSHHKKKKSTDTTADKKSKAGRNAATSSTANSAQNNAATPSLTGTSTPKTTAKTDKKIATDSTRKKGRGKKNISANAPIVVTPTPTTPSTAAPVTVSKSNGAPPITISAPGDTHAGPVVDTGLPVARHSGAANPSAYQVGPSTSSVGSYVPIERARNPLENMSFTNFALNRHNYPWRMNIITTKFWIGEGGTTVSPTDNVASAWDQDWRATNGGSDAPGENRQGYMPAHHAARTNPFYVALPFNDLAFPDKARQWLPAGWYRRPREGKQVSACQHRWLEIKNAQGDICYAQWEDVGPLTYSDAEYVFGGARPQGLGNLRAGLDVSPAVADYLNITGKNCLTRWRFVDDADVRPGVWLKYDEEALIYKAMHEMKNPDPARVLPIQRATAPIDDDGEIDANKKRIGTAKG